MPPRPAEPQIRLASGADIDLLAELYGQAFGEPYTRPAVETLLAAPGAWALVATCGDAPCGFIIARVAADEAEILSLGVAPPARRAGVARALLDAAIACARLANARELFLEVGDDNPAAQALYRSAGFVPVGRRADYYKRADGSRVDALIMRNAVKNWGCD
jgi:ribosomal-protein-alanine N-acetyltransferase